MEFAATNQNQIAAQTELVKAVVVSGKLTVSELERQWSNQCIELSCPEARRRLMWTWSTLDTSHESTR